MSCARRWYQNEWPKEQHVPVLLHVSRCRPLYFVSLDRFEVSGRLGPSSFPQISPPPELSRCSVKASGIKSVYFLHIILRFSDRFSVWMSFPFSNIAKPKLFPSILTHSTSFSMLGPGLICNYFCSFWVIWGNQVVTWNSGHSLLLDLAQGPCIDFCSQNPWFPRKAHSPLSWAVTLAGLSEEAFWFCFCKLRDGTGTGFCFE